MNGAVFETIFNVFFKLNYAKTYDGILATPMGITRDRHRRDAVGAHCGPRSTRPRCSSSCSSWG